MMSWKMQWEKGVMFTICRMLNEGDPMLSEPEKNQEGEEVLDGKNVLKIVKDGGGFIMTNSDIEDDKWIAEILLYTGGSLLSNGNLACFQLNDGLDMMNQAIEGFREVQMEDMGSRSSKEVIKLQAQHNHLLFQPKLSRMQDYKMVKLQGANRVLIVAGITSMGRMGDTRRLGGESLGRLGGQDMGRLGGEGMELLGGGSIGRSEGESIGRLRREATYADTYGFLFKSQQSIHGMITQRPDRLENYNRRRNGCQAMLRSRNTVIPVDLIGICWQYLLFRCLGFWNDHEDVQFLAYSNPDAAFVAKYRKTLHVNY
ncbi:hypothetical protein Tco_1265870, partial [Tanacetum coccineum]